MTICHKNKSQNELIMNNCTLNKKNNKTKSHLFFNGIKIDYTSPNTQKH